MPLRHPAVALAKANRLKSTQNNSEVYKAHAEARQPTDRPTDRQNSFENMRMVSKCAFTMSKQTCAKNKCKCFQLRTRNLWEVSGHVKSCPLLVSRKSPQTEFCAWCPQSVSGARAVLKTLQKKLSKSSWACKFKEASELPKQRVRRLAGSVG